MPYLIRTAFLCGLVPLVLGTVIYVTWTITRWDFLPIAGLITIGIGLLGFTAGWMCLRRQPPNVSGGDEFSRRRIRRQKLVALAVLLFNFPVAAFYMVAAIDVDTRYTLNVTNESGQTLESFVVTGPGLNLELGPIATGDQVKRNLRFQGDGPLNFVARQSPMEFGDRIDDYVTGGMGGECTVVVRSEGKYEVRRLR